MFHGLNLCHAVRIPHKRQVCVQHFHIRTDGVLGLVHDSFQDFLVAALNLLRQSALELRARAGHFKSQHGCIVVLEQILLHQLKCFVIDRQRGRFAANPPRMCILFLMIGESFIECTQLVFLHIWTAANDTQRLVNPVLRIGKVVQTAVNA